MSFWALLKSLKSIFFAASDIRFTWQLGCWWPTTPHQLCGWLSWCKIFTLFISFLLDSNELVCHNCALTIPSFILVEMTVEQIVTELTSCPICHYYQESVLCLCFQKLIFTSLFDRSIMSSICFGKSSKAFHWKIKRKFWSELHHLWSVCLLPSMLATSIISFK